MKWDEKKWWLPVNTNFLELHKKPEWLFGYTLASEENLSMSKAASLGACCSKFWHRLHNLFMNGAQLPRFFFQHKLDDSWFRLELPIVNAMKIHIGPTISTKVKQHLCILYKSPWENKTSRSHVTATNIKTKSAYLFISMQDVENAFTHAHAFKIPFFVFVSNKVEPPSEIWPLISRVFTDEPENVAPGQILGHANQNILQECKGLLQSQHLQYTL